MGDRIQECHNLSLRSVIESYGGRFKGNFFEVPSLWGHESSPSGRIYNKNGIEVYKHYKTGNYGDVIDFVCDYYSYEGEYLDSYMLGEQLVVDGELVISDVYVDESAANLTYLFTDIYNQQYWTNPVE